MGLFDDLLEEDNIQTAPKRNGLFDDLLEEDDLASNQQPVVDNYFTPRPLKTQQEEREIGTFEGITNAAKNAFDSSRQAMDVVGGVTPEEAQNIAKIEFDKKSRKLAPGYDEYQKAEGMDAVLAFAKNPIEVTSNIVAEGLAGSLPALGAGLVTGGVAAAAAAPTVIGAPVAFTAGQVAGTFAGSLATEYGGKVLEELQGEGMDISDPDSIQKFFSNEELMGKVKDKALTRGVPVAAFDAISAGIGGKLGRVFGTKVLTEGEKIIGKQFATKTGEAATELGAQALAGGLGEVSGALAAGEPIEGKAVFGEVIGEVGPGSVEVITGRIADQRAMAKTREEAKIKATSELSAKLEENSAPLTASVVTSKSATNIEQDKLAAQLEEELLIQETAAAAAQLPTTDATKKIIQPEGIRQEPQDGTQIQQATGAGVSDSLLSATRIQEEGQVARDIVSELQAVSSNTATSEQIARLSMEGLVDVRRGQAIINEDGEGILAQAQAPLPKLTPEERVAEVEGQVETPQPTLRDLVVSSGIPKEAADSYIENLRNEGLDDAQIGEMADNLKTLREDADRRNEEDAVRSRDIARRARAGDKTARAELERERGIVTEEPTIGEIPQTSPIVGEQVTETTPVEQVAETQIAEEPIISEKPQTSEIVGAETPAIVEQEQVAPVSQEFKDELMMSGVAYDGNTRYSVQQSSDGTFRAERIANGQREDIEIGLPDIETAQNVIINSVGKEIPAITVETPATTTPKTPQQAPSGMSVEEAKAYLEGRNKSTILGYSPEDIMAMQQGKRVSRTIPAAPVTEAPAITPSPVAAPAEAPAPEVATIQRDVTKPEQMTEEEFSSSGIEPQVHIVNQTASRLGVSNIRDIPLSEIHKQIINDKVGYINQAIDLAKNGIMKGVSKKKAKEVGNQRLSYAKDYKFSASAVDSYGIKLPEGYVKQGDLYVYQPTPAVSEAPTQPEGVAVGNRIKLGKSPQTYTIEEVIPQTAIEIDLGEQYYSVKNERTGEVQVVEAMDMKKVGGKKARKIAVSTQQQMLWSTPNEEIVTPIPEANRYKYEEAVKLVDSYFDKEGIPEGIVIVNNTTDPDLEMKAGYFVDRGQIVINLAYIAKGENLSDIISHELGHFIFSDPQFQADFKAFWDLMTPEEQADADRIINQFYNKETGAIQMEEKQVRAFMQLIQESKAMPKWKQLLDSIKLWINEKLGTNFLVTDRGALSVLAAAHKRFKSGERIIREIDSGVLKTAETAQDAEYLAAVERGDMETAQRMVDEAAKKAGYDIKGFHGTRSQEQFNVFKPNPALGGAIFVATDINEASVFGRVMPVFFKAENVRKGVVRSYNEVQAIAKAKERGQNAIRVTDGMGAPINYAVFNPEQIKSADPVTYDDAGNVIPLSQRFRTTSPDIRRMVAEPRREQVAGRERGDIITTPEGIIKQTNEVLRNKFFDGSEVSDEATLNAWNYIEQMLDIKSGAANDLAGQINDVVDQETNSDTRIGASLFSVSLANYAAKLTAQGDTTMISYIIRRINRMPIDKLAGGISESAAALRAKREYNIDGFNTLKTEGKSKVERTAAALFGTDRPSEEQVKSVDDAIKASEDTSIGEPEEVAGEIEKVEKRTGRKVVKKIEDKIKESTEPKKEELLISFQNLNADKKIKGIKLTYSPEKVNPSKNIKDFIVGKLADYRKTLVNQGAGGLESTFWQTMSDQERKEGPLAELDKAQNNELAKIVQKTLIDLGLKGEPPNTKMTDIEKVASILNENKLSDEKRIEADQRIVAEIERRREGELAAGYTPEAVNAKYDIILDAWNQSMSRQLNMPVSDNMLQRLISSELKEQKKKISELIDEPDGKVTVKTKRNIVDSIIRKIYGVSKEFETGIEIDENYDGLKGYLEKSIDNMYARQIEKKNAAYAKRQAKISLRNNVEGQAQSIIDQLANQLSDTPVFPQKEENQIKAIVQQDLRQKPRMNRKEAWTNQLTAKLIQAGASEAQALTISDLVWRQHEIKAMDRELKELQTAAEKGSLAVIIQRIKDTPLEDQQNPEWMQGVIREYLVEAGLSNQAADTAARLYESVIAERFAEAKQKAFEATLAKSAPWNNYLSRNAQLGKNALKKIQDAIRTGVLDPTQTAEGIIAKESGWSGFSKEQLTRIVQLDGVLSDENANQADKAEAMSELNKIIVKAKMPVRFKDAIGAYYVAQALMGIPTLLVNIVSPIGFSVRNMITDIGRYAFTEPSRIPMALEAFLDSMKSWYNQTLYAFKNQIYMNDVVEYLQGQNVLRELFDKGKDQWAKGDYANGMANMLVGMTQITGRVLSSLDQGAISALENQNITRYAMEAMKQNNIPQNKRKEFANMILHLRRQTYMQNVSNGMASDRAGVLADLAVRNEIVTGLSSLGIRDRVLDSAINDALQTVGRNKTLNIDSLTETTKKLSDDGILSYLPISFLENIAEAAGRQGPAMQVFSKMLYGFALVPARVFHTTAWFSPYGFVRLAVDKYKKNKGEDSPYAMSLQTELQYKQRLTETIAGSVVMLGLAALAGSSTDEDDEKKFKIVITGNGPSYSADRQYFDAWHKKYKPYSINIVMGDTVIPINIGRGGEALFFPIMLAGGLDDWRIKEKLNLAKKEPESLNLAAEVLGSAFFALAQRGPYAAFTKPLFDASKDGKITEELVGQAGFFGKTFIPIVGSSLSRNISDFISDPVDRSSMQGAIYANTPIVGPWLGTKALNALGQPIRADDWGDRLFKLGVPAVFSFPKNTPENELNELILSKGSGPSIPTRSNAQKRFGDVLTDKEFEVYVREYGRIVSDKMFKNRKRLESLPVNKYDDELEKYVRGYSIDGIKVTGASDMAVRAVKRLRNE